MPNGMLCLCMLANTSSVPVQSAQMVLAAGGGVKPAHELASAGSETAL